MNLKVEKKEKNFYDENGGLRLMQHWSPALRWISIIPAIIITFIAIKFLFLGTIIHMVEKESVIASIYVDALTAGLPYLAIVDMAAAVAPKNRVLTSKVTAIIFSVIIVFIEYIGFNFVLSQDVDILPLKTHIIISLIIFPISTLLCLYLGVGIVKDRQKKVNQLESKELVN